MSNKQYSNDFPQKNQHSDRILEMVEWLDAHEKQVFKPFDILLNWKGALFFVVGLSFFAVEVLNFLTSVNADKVFTLLTLLVVFLAFLSIIIQTTELSQEKVRLKRSLRIGNFSDKEKPLLKALLKIKSHNKEFKLNLLYTANKEANGDMFTEKNLLALLCD
jgi:hypothetical protein